MFQIGFGEILVVGVVALFVLGPERLPTVARMVGRLIHRGKSVFTALKNELNEEIKNSAHSEKDHF